MDPSQYQAGFTNPSPTFDHAASRPVLDQDTLSGLPVQAPRVYSELSSETSSNSEPSFGGRNMHRGNRGYQRGGRGSFRGAKGSDRKYSSSSGSSNSQYGINRPILRPSSARQDNPTPVNPLAPGSVRTDSPVTPLKERSEFSLNDHQISETYTPRRTTTTPLRSYASPTAASRNNYGRNSLSHQNPGRQNATQRPLTRNSAGNWASHQEYKIKLLGIPKSYWTRDVYEALSSHGNIVRIEIQPGSVNNAWVTFEYVGPHQIAMRLLTFIA